MKDPVNALAAARLFLLARGRPGEMLEEDVLALAALLHEFAMAGLRLAAARAALEHDPTGPDPEPALAGMIRSVMEKEWKLTPPGPDCFDREAGAPALLAYLRDATDAEESAAVKAHVIACVRCRYLFVKVRELLFLRNWSEKPATDLPAPAAPG